MCECLSYDDGSMHLCEACGPMLTDAARTILNVIDPNALRPATPPPTALACATCGGTKLICHPRANIEHEHDNGCICPACCQPAPREDAAGEHEAALSRIWQGTTQGNIYEVQEGIIKARDAYSQHRLPRKPRK